MKFATITLYLITISLSNLFAQQTKSIMGYVFDKETLKPLPSASIMVDGTPLGAKSKTNGEFEIKDLTPGRYTIIVKYVGYKPAVRANLILSSSRNLFIEIGLEESVSRTEKVYVTAEKDKSKSINQASLVSSKTFTVEETNRYAGAMMDPARMVTNFAGVSAVNDDRNDIIIRGNSPLGVLWRLEGIAIPNPNHFSSYGNTGGPISILNNNNLSNSDFLTGAFPAEYGNAISGAFDLNLKKGNSEEYEVMTQLSLTGLEIGVDGPLFVEQSSVIMNYRYSTLGLLDKVSDVVADLPSIPKYQDITFKISFPNTSTGSWNIFGVAGLSESDFFYKADKDDEDFNTYDENLNKNIYSRNKLGVLGISNTLMLGEKGFLKSTVAVTATKSNTQTDTLTNSQSLLSINNAKEITFQVAEHFSYKLNNKNLFTSGFNAKYLDFTLADSNLINSGSSEGVGNRLVYKVNTNLSDNSLLTEGYMQLEHKFSDYTKINFGIHGTYFNLNKTWSAEPRLGFSTTLSTTHILSLGLGLHSQIQPLPYYFYRNNEGETPNQYLDLTKSLHTVASHKWTLSSNLYLKTEIYYQYLYNIPVDKEPSTFSMVNAGADFELQTKSELVNKGTGKNYGFELTLEKFFDDGYYLLVTGSVFDSKYTASDGIERNTAFNGNYMLAALGGIEFEMFNGFDFIMDTKLTFGGGRRYIPIDLTASITKGQTQYDESHAYNERYKDYFRWDIKVGYRMNLTSTSHYLILDFMNILNTKNEYMHLYDPINKNIASIYQYAFLPNLIYKIEF